MQDYAEALLHLTSKNTKKLTIGLVSQVVIDYWLREGLAHPHTITMKFRHKGSHSIACVRNRNDSTPYISKEEYCKLPPRVQAMLDCFRIDESTLIDQITELERSKNIGRKSIVQKEHPQRRQCTLESKTRTANSYFSEKFVGSIERQNKSIWNTWLQSMQVFAFEDAFAAQILLHADAAEEVQGEALIRCPFTTSYIIGKEENGTKLEFFAVLEENVLRFQQMQNEEAIQSCEMRIDQHRTGMQILDAIEDSSRRSAAMKMLQLYSCLCSAAFEGTPSTKLKPEPMLSASEEPKRTLASKKEIPSWDVDVYTVTMRREIKKQHHRPKANDSADISPRKPHPRRAHWHHYWVGSRKDEASRRLVLKWLPEIVVNQKEEDMPVRIILVRNNK